MAIPVNTYNKHTWVDNSSPDLEAEILNEIETGIKDNNDAIKAIAAAVVSQIVNDPDKIASMAALYAVNQTLGTLSTTVTNINSNLAGLGNSKADKAQVHDLRGINPSGFSLLNWAADEAKRLSIWKTDTNTVADFPDDSEWCALNLQDGEGARGIVVAFKYFGDGGTSVKYRCYFNKTWLGGWKTIV